MNHGLVNVFHLLKYFVFLILVKLHIGKYLEINIDHSQLQNIFLGKSFYISAMIEQSKKIIQLIQGSSCLALAIGDLMNLLRTSNQCFTQCEHVRKLH